MYDKSIDRETYQEQLARLREEQLSVEMELNESKVDEFDVESAVNFALHAIGDASRFWLEASLEQKQRFQRALFPGGLAFDGNKFETARTCLAFSPYKEFRREFRFGVPYGIRTRVAAVKENRITVIQRSFAA